MWLGIAKKVFKVGVESQVHDQLTYNGTGKYSDGVGSRLTFLFTITHFLTTVTCCCSAALVICSDVFRLYKMLQHILLLVPDIVNT